MHCFWLPLPQLFRYLGIILDWEDGGHMPTERLIYGSFNKTEQQRCTCYHISLLKASQQFLSSSMSGLYVSVFLFALLFADHFLLFTNQTSQHHISSKCQDYTTDLITCHFNHTSLCKPVIQSNTVPNVNREEKKIKAIPQQGKDGRAGKRKGNIFIEKERLLCYLQLSFKKRQNQTLNYHTIQSQKKCHQLPPTMTFFSVKTKCCTYIQKYKQIHTFIKGQTFCKKIPPIFSPSRCSTWYCSLVSINL